MGAFAGIQTRRLLRLLFRLISFDRAVPQTEFFPSEKIVHGSLRRLSNVNMVAYVPHRFKREKRARHGFVVKIRGDGRDARAGRGRDARASRRKGSCGDRRAGRAEGATPALLPISHRSSWQKAGGGRGYPIVRKKQLRAPVWQAGPWGETSASSVSASQS